MKSLLYMKYGDYLFKIIQMGLLLNKSFLTYFPNFFYKSDHKDVLNNPIQLKFLKSTADQC